MRSRREWRQNGEASEGKWGKKADGEQRAMIYIRTKQHNGGKSVCVFVCVCVWCEEEGSALSVSIRASKMQISADS